MAWLLPVLFAVCMVAWSMGSCAGTLPRPPVILHVGGVYGPKAPRDQQWSGVAKVTVPIKPVGFWVDVRYDFGPDRNYVGGTSFGVIFYFPGNMGLSTPEANEDATIYDSDNDSHPVNK